MSSARNALPRGRPPVRSSRGLLSQALHTLPLGHNTMLLSLAFPDSNQGFLA